MGELDLGGGSGRLEEQVSFEGGWGNVGRIEVESYGLMRRGIQ